METRLFALQNLRSSLPTVGSSISDILPSRLISLPRQGLNLFVPSLLEYLLRSRLCQFLGF